MKHLFFYIVYFFLLFNTSTTAAEPLALPDDFEGKFTRQLLQNTDNPSENADFEQTINYFGEISLYIYKHYTVEQIAQEDFIEKLKPFFPNDSEYDLQEKQAWLVNGISAYNKGQEYYNSFMEKLLFTPPARVVKNESDFDHPDEVSYVEAQPGHYIKVYNFKKFLTYGQNEEVQAIADFQEAQLNPKGFHNTLKNAVQRLEWKKLFFYGTVFKNPLLSDLGVAEWQKNNDISARLLSPHTYIDGHKELDFGIQINTEPFTFIPANNPQPDIYKPTADFSASENVESAELLYPAPLTTVKHPHIHKYFGNFMLPIKVRVTDPKKPLILRATLKLLSCDNSLNCSPTEFKLELSLKSKGTEIFNNGYENYFFVNNSILPKADLKKLQLNRLVYDSDDEGPFLRLKFKSKPSVKNFKVFLEQLDGYTAFSAPLVSFRDNQIYVRFNPLDKNADLKNKTFQITAVLNNRYYYRTTQKSVATSIFDADAPSLNFYLILFALIGGFILNFMPCVFPVLSLKIIAFSRVKAKHRKSLKSNLISTVAGIFSGFTLLIFLLLICKHLGYSLGWGMQFQSITFLVVMTFFILALAVTIPSLSTDYLSRYLPPHLNRKFGFIVGNLIVLLSTPCAAPYLATAVGFALSGGYVDIIVILYAVALGLAIPYILILTLKKPETLFPKPGKWMNYLAGFMHLMLYLTVLWLLSLILGQTDWKFLLKFSVILLIFAYILIIYNRFLDYLNGIFDESVTIQQINSLRFRSYVVMGTVFAVLIVISAYMARQSYALNLQHNLQTRQTIINSALIEQHLNQGKPVLLEIGADWCLTCHVNNVLIFNKLNMNLLKEQYNLELIKVDWTNYNKEILQFMEKYGRKGLPFYILYTPLIREGLVMPEIFNVNNLIDILQSSVTR